jgi:hypothetical protein
MIRSASHVDTAALMDRIVEMEKLAISGDSRALLEVLCEIVPNFQPVGLNAKANGSAEPKVDLRLAVASHNASPAVALATKTSKSTSKSRLR